MAYRAVVLLALLAAAYAAPTVHQVAAPAGDDDLKQETHQEQLDQTAEQTGEQTGVTGESAAVQESAESGPDVRVSVETSTSMEISRVMSSVSSEMSPMVASETPSEMSSAEPEVAAVVAEEEGEENKAGAQTTVTDTDVSLNEISDSTKFEENVSTEANSEFTTGEDIAEKTVEKVKAEQEQEQQPTPVPETVEVSTSTSMQVTEVTMSVTSELGRVPATEEKTEQFGAVVADSAEEPALNAPEQPEHEGSGVEADFNAEDIHSNEENIEASGRSIVDLEGSGAEENQLAISFDGEQEEASGHSSQKEDDNNTTKGTLIFALGADTTPELHDLVQQTVLDAIMDEGLLSATEVSPVIQVEGSGVVFDDSVEGSGSGGDIEAAATPYVSIHF